MGIAPSTDFALYRWAWQHSDRSRHTNPGKDADSDDDSGLAKTPRAKPRSSRARRSLTAHLEDLHMLLRAKYFANWPLRIRFFCIDVYRVWKIWNERVDARFPESKVILDGDCQDPQEEPSRRVGSIQNISTDYTPLENHLEKSMFLLQDAEDLQCQICKASVIPGTEQIVVCSQATCRGTSHVLCLSEHFLEGLGNPDVFIPTHGTCPACKETVQWPLLMKEMNLRNRAEKEVRTILRRKEKRERKETSQASPAKRKKKASARETSVEPTASLIGSDPPLEDDWCEREQWESDTEHGVQQRTISTEKGSKMEIVIEDSEWDDAEIIE